MSEIKVNSIKGVGASTAAITVNNTDGTCTANITNNLSNRNLIINGAMQVAQRGTTSTSSGYYTVDRFKVINSGTDEAPEQEQGVVASGTTPYTLGFRKVLKVTNGNQTSGAGGGDFIWIQTIIEAQNIANSGWNYTSSSSNITLSFWVKSSVAQDFKGYLRSSDGTNYEYPFATGSLSADTWTKVTKTIPGNSNLQFDTNNEAGLEINILPFLGTDRTDGSVTENAWATYSSSARTKDHTSTWYTTNDATFEITGVQLEVGSVATDFEHRSFGQELALCQRYFNRYNTETTNGHFFLAAGVNNGTGARGSWPFTVPMRAIPSFALSNLSHFQELSTAKGLSSITLADSGTGKNLTGLTITFSSNTSGGFAHIIRAGSTSAYFEFDAEL